MANRLISDTHTAHNRRSISTGQYSSDQELLSRIAKGDKDSFGILYQRYLESIYNYIYFHINRNHHETEDLTEEVFLRTFKIVLEKPKGNNNFRALVFKIARNLVIDRYRTNKDEAAIEDFNTIAHHNHDPEKILEKSQLNKKLSDAISELKSDQREVVILRYLLDLNTDEIAQIMGITHNYVRVIQYRALENLKISL